MRRTETNDDIICVVDADGGTWWPDDDARDEIKVSDDPHAIAVRTCDETPMRGEWRS